MKKLFLASLCAAMLLLSACGGAPAASPTPEATPEQPPVSAEPSVPPVEPSAQPTAEPAGTKDFSLTMEGAEVVIPMTYTELTGSNCPELALYVDTEMFLTREFEGECDVLPVDGGGDPAGWIHFSYFGVSADAKAEETLNESGYRLYTDEGMATLGGYDAYLLSFKNADDSNGDFMGYTYFIPSGEGTLCVDVFYTAEAAEGMEPRLMLMADTLELK